jgi:hypothetical protein
LQLD